MDACVRACVLAYMVICSQFASDPALFDVYHAGFRESVCAWPSNPVDVITARLVCAYLDSR